MRLHVRCFFLFMILERGDGNPCVFPQDPERGPHTGALVGPRRAGCMVIAAHEQISHLVSQFPGRDSSGVFVLVSPSLCPSEESPRPEDGLLDRKQGSRCGVALPLAGLALPPACCNKPTSSVD